MQIRHKQHQRNKPDLDWVIFQILLYHSEINRILDWEYNPSNPNQAVNANDSGASSIIKKVGQKQTKPNRLRKGFVPFYPSETEEAETNELNRIISNANRLMVRGREVETGIAGLQESILYAFDALRRYHDQRDTTQLGNAHTSKQIGTIGNYKEELNANTTPQRLKGTLFKNIPPLAQRKSGGSSGIETLLSGDNILTTQRLKQGSQSAVDTVRSNNADQIVTKDESNKYQQTLKTGSSFKSQQQQQ
ncbi:MAG: hypothetical protein EZS28_048268, partial [Streblomastix strix]